MVLSPAIGVISLVWQQHLGFIAAQHLLYVVNSAQQLSTNKENIIAYVLIYSMFFAPISFCLGITLHNRYVAYRATVLQRQVEMLERLWQRNTCPKEIIL
jgi:ABC-type polysaccharide/polyol phosphate export permease